MPALLINNHPRDGSYHALRSPDHFGLRSWLDLRMHADLDRPARKHLTACSSCSVFVRDAGPAPLPEHHPVAGGGQHHEQPQRGRTPEPPHPEKTARCCGRVQPAFSSASADNLPCMGAIEWLLHLRGGTAVDGGSHFAGLESQMWTVVAWVT